MINKKAEMGMGTLIIFIAMILVAAIAAAVLISTTTSLQSKALETGSATRQEVGTSLTIIEVTATDGTNGTTILNNFTSLIRLSAGSDPIRFADTLLTFNLNNVSSSFRYEADANCSNVTGTQFAVRYEIEGNDNREGYLVNGDVASVCFIAPRSLSEGEKFRMTFTPRVGAPANVETTVPNILNTQRVKLFP